MVIEKIEISHFRSILSCVIFCENLIALVGPNGAGKSTVLSALDVFYDVGSQITEEDFYNRDTENPISIRVTYGKLRPEERTEFANYMRDEKMIVTKRISFENGSPQSNYYGASNQIRQFAEIRSLSGKTNQRSAWKTLVENDELNELSGTSRSADHVEEMMQAYEASHPDLREPIERPEQFFGPKNIGGGKLDNFTKFVLVPAVREASDEASGRKGSIYQILDMLVLKSINSRSDIVEFRKEYETKAKEVYSSENLSELPELAASISKTLTKFAPGSKLNLAWEEVSVPEVPLPSAFATLVEDGFEGDIARKGHGLQRALILTLLQHLAISIHTKNMDREEDTREEGGENARPETVVAIPEPDLIIAIEEPELYLHPSRAQYLSSLLLRLTEEPDIGLGSNNQVFYTTHSPYFIDLERFDNIRIARKQKGDNDGPPVCSITQFSIDNALEEVARISDLDLADISRESFKARTNPVMSEIVNKGFFADLVVVVEGLSDVGILWKLQEILSKGWTERGIVVIPANGKNNIDRPVIIFKGFGIPTYFVWDGDSKHQGGNSEAETAKRNLRYLKLADSDAISFPETHVSDNWAVFNDDIEGLIKSELGEQLFTHVKNETADELGYDQSSLVLKNVDGSARFIELIYEQGHQINILEEIVQKITDLSQLD